MRELRLSTPAGEAVGLLAVVDLSAGVEVVVTGPAPQPLPDGADALLMPTDRFVAEHSVDLAINANFFSWIGDKKTTQHADILGLTVSDGVVVSPPRVYKGEGDPAIVFTRDGRAVVGLITPDMLEAIGAYDAVAGIGTSANDPAYGGLLVQDGQSRGALARVEPDKRHPRTGVGVDAAGTRVYLAVFDGRQPGRSVGLTLPELAEVLIEAGADDAVALDGGGSSAMVVKPAYAPGLDPLADGYDDGWVSNRPSDGRFRPVANHLGFRVLRSERVPASSPAGQ